MNIDLDVFGNPIINTSLVKMFADASIIHLYNQHNFINLDKLSKLNYFSFLSNKVDFDKGLYLISRVESPIINKFNYLYVGSSYQNVAERASKFVRNVLGLTTPGDRGYSYCDLYVRKFGRNLENTFVSFFEIPKEYELLLKEQDVRNIEGHVIRESMRIHGNIVANKNDRPTTSMMTEKLKRTRNQESSSLQF
jgi:hypothetical protein